MDWVFLIRQLHHRSWNVCVWQPGPGRVLRQRRLDARAIARLKPERDWQESWSDPRQVRHVVHLDVLDLCLVLRQSHLVDSGIAHVPQECCTGHFGHRLRYLFYQRARSLHLWAGVEVWKGWQVCLGWRCDARWDLDWWAPAAQEWKFHRLVLHTVSNCIFSYYLLRMLHIVNHQSILRHRFTSRLGLYFFKFIQSFLLPPADN